jgi:Sec-independent protein translocase protein TatA
MFNESFHLAFIGPGGPEFLVVMLVLLMMFGAKDAPRILRKLNEIISQIRNTADGFKREVMYGDLNNDKSAYEPPDNTDESDYDEDYDYTENYSDDEYYGDDVDDSSDEAFQETEETPVGEAPLPEEPETEPAPEPEISEDEDDDAQKA